MLVDGRAGRPVLMQAGSLPTPVPEMVARPDAGRRAIDRAGDPHYDLARYFFGDARAVTSFVDNLVHLKYDDYKVDDVSASTIQFKNGAIASICASNCADPQAGSVTFTVLCEKVMAEFRTPDDATFSHHGGKPGEQWAGEKVTREEVKSTGRTSTNCRRTSSARSAKVGRRGRRSKTD